MNQANDDGRFLTSANTYLFSNFVSETLCHRAQRMQTITSGGKASQSGLLYRANTHRYCPLAVMILTGCLVAFQTVMRCDVKQ